MVDLLVVEITHSVNIAMIIQLEALVVAEADYLIRIIFQLLQERH